MDDEPLREGAEVYSLMRDSEPPRKKHLNWFFATGSEHETAGATTTTT
jgi:hypothetical protein